MQPTLGSTKIIKYIYIRQGPMAQSKPGNILRFCDHVTNAVFAPRDHDVIKTLDETFVMRYTVKPALKATSQ